MLRNIKVATALDNFLQDGLKTPDSTKLWISGNEIVALQANGKERYYSGLPKGTWFSFFFLWIFSVPAMIIPLYSASHQLWLAILMALFVPSLFYFKSKKHFDAASEGGQKI